MGADQLGLGDALFWLRYVQYLLWLFECVRRALVDQCPVDVDEDLVFPSSTT